MFIYNIIYCIIHCNIYIIMPIYNIINCNIGEIVLNKDDIDLLRNTEKDIDLVAVENG